ncbi:TPA: hypothetical protein R1915_001471 [Staphylococcus delphini]|nr:hypothetical protein [Staphylococcus delphini]
MINNDMILKETIEYLFSGNNKYVVLDVDRTIMNCTPWFKACIKPDLLIAKSDTNNFIYFNKLAYDDHILPLSDFRKKTLDLIWKHNKFNVFIKGTTSLLIAQNKFDSILYSSAKEVAKQLSYYEECMECIRELRKMHGKNLHFIFLSSGYSNFIKGVVDSFIEQAFSEKVDYYVLGSEVKVSLEGFCETFFMSQLSKELVVRSLILKRAEIILFADDSSENPNLFKLVADQGGIAIKIDYKSGQESSNMWKDTLNSIKKDRILQRYSGEKIQLLDKERVNSLIDFIENHTNEIGIYTLNIQDFIAWKKRMCFLRGIEEFDALIKNLNNLFFVKKGLIYLRGPLYYYWLPSNSGCSNNDLYDSFKNLLFLLDKIVIEIVEGEFIQRIGGCQVTNIILLSILEHIQHVFIVVINMIEKAEIEKEEKIDINLPLNKMAQDITDLIFQLLEKKLSSSVVINVLNKIDFLKLLSLFNEYMRYHQGMRELDNLISSYRAIKHIVSSNNIAFDYIIPFFYGGASLGYSFISYIKLHKSVCQLPILVNCHFSSKKEIREGKDLGIEHYIPKSYSLFLKDIKKGNKKLLLFDNNSTTLKTMKCSKEFFESFNNKTFKSVVSFNYSNFKRYKSNIKPYEKLIDDWQSQLDFKIVEEYITAFDSWGTSKKANILKSIYLVE